LESGGTKSSSAAKGNNESAVTGSAAGGLSTNRGIDMAFIDSLKTLHQTENLFEVFKREVAARQWGSALIVFEQLPSLVQIEKESRLLYMRAVIGRGSRSQIAEFFNGPEIDDGEYYLKKAHYLLSRRAYARALNSINMAEDRQCLLMSNSVSVTEALYLRAQIWSDMYFQSPSEVSRARAVNGWLNIKFTFRNRPEHPYVHIADSLIKSLSTE
jgi:hypothetical protein